MYNIRRDVEKAQSSREKVTTPRKQRKQRKTMQLDNFDQCLVRRKFLEFLEVKKTIPTLKNLLSVVKSETEFNGSKETFRKILRNMGFRFQKCKNKRHILIERRDIVARRAEYLRALRNNDKGPQKPVVYTDETWLHTHYTVQKCWQDETMPGVLVNSSAGERLIIVHAGGWVLLGGQN